MFAYDVKAFGAKGDNSTNDTAAIQACINAAQAVDGQIWFPEGNYRCGALTATSGHNLFIRGAGRATLITPLSSSQVCLSVTDLLGGYLQNVDIADITFYAAGFPGVNTLYGIKLLSVNNPKIRNVAFFNVMNAIFLDRVSGARIDDCFLWDNSSIYIGSTVAGGNYAFNNVVTNLHQVISNPGAGSFSYTGAIVNLERAVSATINNVILYLAGIGNGISIRNDCQSVLINGGTIEGPVKGIEILRNTVGGTAATPLETVIRGGLNIDNYKTYAVYAPDGLYTNLDGLVVTGGAATATAIHAIYFGNTNTQLAPTVNNCRIQSGSFAGDGIVMDGGIKSFAIENNYFNLNLTGGGVDIYVVTAGSDHYIITGNSRDAADTSFALVFDNGSAPKTVANNQ